MLLSPEQSRRLITHAVEQRYAILAVNADSPAAITDCLEAARQCDAPLIIETSLWQLTGKSYGNGNAITGLARYLTDLAVVANRDPFRHVPVVYHTDHIKGPETASILQAAIQGVPFEFFQETTLLRASSVSLDSSELSAEANIALMCQLCEFAETDQAHATLEMEAGVDRGVTAIEETDRVFGTVERRHPNHLALWAPGLGTEHGLNTGNHVDPDAVRAHQERASEICERPIGIALHGSSGLSPEALKAAVQAGTAKVNWSSESLLVRSQAAREYFASHTAELDAKHPKFKVTAMDNGLQSFVGARYQPVVADRIRLLGGEGQASAFRALLEPATN